MRKNAQCELFPAPDWKLESYDSCGEGQAALEECTRSEVLWPASLYDMIRLEFEGRWFGTDVC